MSFEWSFMLFTLLLLPLLVLAYVLVQQQRKKNAVKFSNVELLREIADDPGWKRHIPPALFLLGLAALCVSLARPIMSLTLPRKQAAVMLVLDVSYSMQAQDLQPTRFDAAKLSIKNFVAQLPSNALVGLVSFSGKANLNAPLTGDHAAVLAAVDGLKLDNGTAIGDGMIQALDHIAAQNNGAPATIILLSDGESQAGVAPLDAANRAALMQIEVNTVGIGTRGARTKITESQSVGLDETTLQTIATKTGGTYFYAAQANELDNIYKSLSAQVSMVHQPTEITAVLAGIGALLMVASALLSLRWFQQFP